jgi:Cys-rich protein (TIGR01571 family)
LFKDTQEWYIERQHGLKYDNSIAYVPDSLLEEYIGNWNYRGIGVLCTCGLAALTGGVFDLLWCCLLAHQRRQVRDMYHIDGSPCCDCFLACCCRCCMFNQLKHQLVVDNPKYPSDPLEQVNIMQPPQDKFILPRIVLKQSKTYKKANPGMSDYV